MAGHGDTAISSSPFMFSGDEPGWGDRERKGPVYRHTARVSWTGSACVSTGIDGGAARLQAVQDIPLVGLASGDLDDDQISRASHVECHVHRLEMIR